MALRRLPSLSGEVKAASEQSSSLRLHVAPTPGDTNGHCPGWNKPIHESPTPDTISCTQNHVPALKSVSVGSHLRDALGLHNHTLYQKEHP